MQLHILNCKIEIRYEEPFFFSHYFFAVDTWFKTNVLKSNMGDACK